MYSKEINPKAKPKFVNVRARIFKLLRSPRINSKVPVPVPYSYSVPSPHKLFKIPEQDPVPRNRFRQRLYCSLAGRYDNPTYSLESISRLLKRLQIRAQRSKACVRLVH
jgi:hypothetical protein